MKTFKVLFLGIGNSTGSLMAEGLLRRMGGDLYQAWSAGSAPAGFVHPETLNTLRRHGIEPGPLASKSWNEYSIRHFDLIVSVCAEMADEIWPLFPDRPEILCWNVPDPAHFTTHDAGRDETFDQVFFRIRRHIEDDLLNRHILPVPVRASAPANHI